MRRGRGKEEMIYREEGKKRTDGLLRQNDGGLRAGEAFIIVRSQLTDGGSSQQSYLNFCSVNMLDI